MGPHFTLLLGYGTADPVVQGDEVKHSLHLNVQLPSDARFRQALRHPPGVTEIKSETGAVGKGEGEGGKLLFPDCRTSSLHSGAAQRIQEWRIGSGSTHLRKRQGPLKASGLRMTTVNLGQGNGEHQLSSSMIVLSFVGGCLEAQRVCLRDT